PVSISPYTVVVAAGVLECGSRPWRQLVASTTQGPREAPLTADVSQHCAIGSEAVSSSHLQNALEKEPAPCRTDPAPSTLSPELSACVLHRIIVDGCEQPRTWRQLA